MEAKISTGTYKCADYREKLYTTLSGLKKGLKAKGYPYTDIFSTNWNRAGIQYKLSINN